MLPDGEIKTSELVQQAKVIAEFEGRQLTAQGEELLQIFVKALHADTVSSETAALAIATAISIDQKYYTIPGMPGMTPVRESAAVVLEH